MWRAPRRWMTVAVTVAALVVLAAGGTRPASAQTDQPAVEAEGMTPEEEALLSRYDANAREAADLGVRVDQSSLVLAAAEADLAAAAQRAAVADAHLVDVRNRIGEAERRLTDEEARLRAKAISAYIGGREQSSRPVGDVLASSATSESLVEAGSRAAYTEVVVSDQRSTVARVAATRDEVRSLRAEAEELQAGAAAERDGVARRRDEVAGQRDGIVALRLQAADRAAQDQALVDAVIGRGRDHALRTVASRAGADSIAGALLRRQYGQALVLPSIGILSRPVAGAYLSSGFGYRSDPLSGEVARHEGVDLAAAEGTPLTAPADGVVVVAGEVSGYGLATVIDHGDGLATLLGHQSELLVIPGQAVVRGDLIGRVGSTGKSTGPHLHLEVRVFGVPEDPRPYLAP